MELNVVDFKNIIKHYFPEVDKCEILPITSGLINKTYRIVCDQQNYILQQIETNIFKNPESISYNIRLLSNHLKQTAYPFEIIDILSTLDNKTIVTYKNEVWRILSYVAHGKTTTTVKNAQQAFEAAKAFSAFYLATADFDLPQLKIAIPNFTNFLLRIKQFEAALKTGKAERKELAYKEIQSCKENLHLIHEYIAVEKLLPLRLIHGDPKISNILFDKNGRKALAIIDLDTLMLGSILYDYGDMIRSYTNKYPEDVLGEKPFSLDYYLVVKNGFLHYLSNTLTKNEIKHLDLAAQTLVLVQAMRFLSDFLQGDPYYKTTHPLQNLNRAKNQLLLLDAMNNML